MQTLFVADKKLGELEALFGCEVSDDDAPWTRDAQHAQELWTLSEQLTA